MRFKRKVINRTKFIKGTTVIKGMRLEKRQIVNKIRWISSSIERKGSILEIAIYDSLSKLGIFDFVKFVFYSDKLRVLILAHLVNIVQVLRLLHLLHQVNLILVQKLLVAWVTRCILANSLVQRSVNCVHIVFERYLDKLTPVFPDYLYARKLFRKVKLLPKHIALV